MKTMPIKLYNRNYIDFSNFRELPLNKQLFEGILYLDYGNSKWLKRLFRFNGETLVCLSPTLTHLPSRITNSTKDASESLHILLKASDAPKGYYYVPEWTIDLKSISSIALLQQPTVNSPHSTYLSIQTLNGIRRNMKSPYLEDLERWAFVLTKTWNPISNVPNPYTYSSIHNSKHQQQAPHLETMTTTAKPVKKEPQFINPTPATKLAYLSYEDIHRNSRSHPIPENKTVWIEQWIDSFAQLSLDASLDTKNPHHSSLTCESLDQDATSSVSSYSIQTRRDSIAQVKSNENGSSNKELVETFHVNFFQDVDTTEADETSLYYNQYNNPHLSYHHSRKAQQIKLMQQKQSPTGSKTYSPNEDLSPTYKKHMSYFDQDKSPLDKVGVAHYTTNIYEQYLS